MTAISAKKAIDSGTVDKWLKSLPMSHHALKSHAGEKVGVLALEIYADGNLCKPRILFLGCEGGRTARFACKINPLQRTSLWAGLVIGTPYGKNMMTSANVITLIPMSEAEVYRSARAKGCIMQPVVLP